ncbi:hypothetical protein BRM99_23365, partial [Xanthomonas oryzae pv. oryzae]
MPTSLPPNVALEREKTTAFPDRLVAWRCPPMSALVDRNAIGRMIENIGLSGRCTTGTEAGAPMPLLPAACGVTQSSAVAAL